MPDRARKFFIIQQLYDMNIIRDKRKIYIKC